jgi:twitching motility protein PilT
VTRLVGSSWSDDQERDALLAELIGQALAPADALLLAQHDDAEVATAGQRLFAARANPKAIRELLHSVSDAKPVIRDRLFEVARLLPAPLIKEEIDQLLRSREPANRRLGWDTAIQLTGGLRQLYLQKAVLVAPPAMRIKALDLMLEERDGAEIQPLLLKLADAEDRRLANRALQALAGLRGDDVLELMLSRFATSDAQSRAVASEYLKREAVAAPELVRQTMLQGLTNRDRLVRKAAAEILFASGPAEVIVREALQYCSGLLGWLRSRVLGGLAEGGRPVMDATLELLRHPDESTRFYALTLADSFAEPELVEPFCRLLHDPDWWIRITVCDSLARLGNDRAVPKLIEVLGDDEVRWAAIDALGRLGSGAAIQPLIDLLKDPREEVRLEVLQGLSRLQDERLIPVLQHARGTDEALAVRRRANEIIEQLVVDLGLEGVEAGSYLVEQTFDLPLQKLLYEARHKGASDVHITAGEPPQLRLDGRLVPAADAVLTPSQAKEQILSLLAPAQQEELTKRGELDFKYELPGVGRYRGSAFLSQRGWNASYRIIADTAPTMEMLGLPDTLLDLVNYSQGIVAFCGPTGSGKSSSLTAVVNRFNERRSIHIITLEDPVEFLHTSKLALINQREIGVHTSNTSEGLRASLREDPDIIVIGELRDSESIRLAMQAAETGHLVLTTLHTGTVTQAVERLVGAFAPEEQDHARSALAETLKFVVCQRLLPKAQPPGRVAVFEVLKVTPSIGHLIRKAETHQIPGMMQLGSGLGNVTMDQALLEQVEKRVIKPEEAWHHARKPALFEALCDPAWLAERGVRDA